jgi:hypothetical protein
LAFIRWRKARGYIVTPFKRQFWGRHAWRKQIAISITANQLEMDL